jgi:uncharacterized protein
LGTRSDGTLGLVREPETTETDVARDREFESLRPERVPWRWWDAVVVFALVQVLVTLLAGLVVAAAGEQALIPTLVVATSVVTILLTLLWVRLRYPGHTRRLFGPARPSAASLGEGIVVGGVAFLGANVGLSVLIEAILERTGGELPPVQQELQAALADSVLGPLVMVSVIVLAPLAEELLFRGVLFTGLRRMVPVWAAIALSALGFALTHVEWLAIVVITPVGALFAWAYQRRGTLAVPIVAHATFNLINVILLRVGAP